MRFTSRSLRYPAKSISLYISVFVLAALFAVEPGYGQTASPEFDRAAQAATKAREAGKTNEAIKFYKEAVQLRPEWAEGWWYVGTMQYDADQFAPAIPAFQALMKLAPQASAAWNFLGLCEFEIADYDSAKRDLEEGLARGKAGEEDTGRVARYHLALLRNRAGEFEKSIELLKQEFAGGPLPNDAQFALGLATLHVGLLPRDVDPSKDAVVSEVGEAAALLAQGRMQDAILAFGKAAQKYPDTPFLNYGYGSALAASGDQERAIAAFQQELKIFPQNAPAQIALSRIELKKGKRSAAQELQDAEKLLAGSASPDPRIARLYTRSDASEGASSGRALSTNDTAFEEFARAAAARQAEGRPLEAIANYERALQIRPGWDDGLWNLAMLDYSQGRPAESLAALKSWTARHANLGAAWAVMGLCEFALKDYDNSLIHLERGEELGLSGAPEAVRTARYHYAMLLTRAGQFQKASQVLANHALNAESDKELQFVLGLASLRIAKLPGEVIDTQNSLVARTGEAVAMLTASKYDLGIPKVKQLIADYPGTPMLHFIYGKASSALSNYDEAAEQFELEAKQSSKEPAPFVELALTRLQQHRPTDAQPLAEHAVQLAPNSAEAHYALGRVYLELKRIDLAVTQLELASRLAPGSPEVHFNLAKAYARQNQPEKAEAERAIFARLNALAEERRSGQGNQAYGATRAEDTLSSAPPANAPATTPNQN
jgi:tetratricopeptide (TPR) repeat protein